MDNAADLAAVLALDRDNVAAIAHGNHALLQVFRSIHVADHAFQPVTDAVFGCTDLFAQLVQGAGSRIRHRIRSQNGTGDLLFQTWFRGQRIEQVIGRQCVMVRGAVPAAQILEITQCTCHHQQFAHGEHAALDRTRGQLADTLYPTKPGRTVFDEQGVDRIRLLQCIANLIRVTLGLQFQHFFPGFLAHTALRRPCNDLVKLQCF